MAYSGGASGNPPRLISQGVGASTGSLWHYTDGDAIATVTGSLYFDDGDVLGMKVNDTIIVTDETLGEVYTCIVSVSTAGSGATIALRQTNNAEVVITTNVITADESGKTFYLSLAGGFTSTLPAPALGLKFKFIVAVAPTTAYIITTNAGADILIGGVNELEVDTSDDGPYDDNADTVNFVASVAAVGDFIEMESDGTSWYFNGQTNLDGGVTTSTT